jgi:hypothetical protein
MLLHDGREEMARKTIECFRAQTYSNKRLMILDTRAKFATNMDRAEIYQRFAPEFAGQPIGWLRNEANGSALESWDDTAILVHWDSDDYSHPARIARQVTLLQASEADAVGYREALFFREDGGEAWLYKQRAPKYALGGTLCYWRKTWEEKPFPDLMTGEDTAWIEGLNVVGISGVPDQNYMAPEPPRFIARIHAGNTSKAYKPELMRAVQAQSGEWQRVPGWDHYCRGVMAL